MSDVLQTQSFNCNNISNYRITKCWVMRIDSLVLIKIDAVEFVLSWVNEGLSIHAMRWESVIWISILLNKLYVMREWVNARYHTIYASSIQWDYHTGIVWTVISCFQHFEIKMTSWWSVCHHFRSIIIWITFDRLTRWTWFCDSS